MIDTNPGSLYLTSSTSLSSKPVRMKSVTWLCGSAGDIILRNGTTIASTYWVQEAGTANKSKTLNFEGGLCFSNGCYVQLGANVSAAIVTFDVLN